MDKNSVHFTTPTPTPSSPRCWSLPSWSASMSECGSAPDGRDSFPPFALLGFVAATHRSSYGAFSKNESPAATPVAKRVPLRTEGTRFHHLQDWVRSCNPPHQLRALPRNESPAATPAAKRVPLRTGGTRFHHLQDWVRSCNPPHQLRCASKNESLAAKRVPHPGHREHVLFTEATCAVHNRRQDRRCS